MYIFSPILGRPFLAILSLLLILSMHLSLIGQLLFEMSAVIEKDIFLSSEFVDGLVSFF